MSYLEGAEEVDGKIGVLRDSSRSIYGWRVKGLLERYEDKVKHPLACLLKWLSRCRAGETGGGYSTEGPPGGGRVPCV